MQSNYTIEVLWKSPAPKNLEKNISDIKKTIANNRIEGGIYCCYISHMGDESSEALPDNLNKTIDGLLTEINNLKEKGDYLSTIKLKNHSQSVAYLSYAKQRITKKFEHDVTSSTKLIPVDCVENFDEKFEGEFKKDLLATVYHKKFEAIFFYFNQSGTSSESSCFGIFAFFASISFKFSRDSELSMFSEFLFFFLSSSFSLFLFWNFFLNFIKRFFRSYVLLNGVLCFYFF